MVYLITGGSGSGKSEYAENLAVRLRESKGAEACGLYYVATMYPHDRECEERIARHRLQRRDKGFSTVECPCGISRVQAGKKDVLLLECMSNLLANEMYLAEGGIKDRGERAGEQLEETVIKPLMTLAGQAGGMVIVTNEVFSDGVRYDTESEKYRELLGKLNIRLAARADALVEVVFGVPILYKGEVLP